VIPIPAAWTRLPQVTVAVSVDGNPEDHDVRRKPATYDRILKNIEGCRVNIHWTVVRKNVEQRGYMDRYLSFWNDRPEVRNIWISVYTPQREEESAERLTPHNRSELAAYFNGIGRKYSKLTMHPGLMHAFLEPPASPADCLFSTLSVNYTADLRTRVEPCVFGGAPSCAECGCSMSMGMHWLGSVRVLGPLRASHLIRSSLAIGRGLNRASGKDKGLRRTEDRQADSGLIQIGP
jgi:hypothetical protein